MSILPVKCSFAILIMSIRTCPKCSAVFIDGQLKWLYSGKDGDPRDLAGLVCQPYGNADCINPMKNFPGGDTFAKRCQILENPLTLGDTDP